MFKWLFGSKGDAEREQAPQQSSPPRDVDALVASLCVPALRLESASTPGKSFLGGVPQLPADVAWPKGNDGECLGLLTSIDLEEAQRELSIEWLPQSGTLLFFYDHGSQPWGFDPKDRGGWAVLYVAAGEALQIPTGPASGVLPRVPVEFRRMDSKPSCQRKEVEALDLTPAERDLLDDGMPGCQHQMGGFPVPVQNDSMEVECQLVSHGIYCGDAKGYGDPRVDTLRQGAGEWRLLLQFDSDDRLDVMWGDVGMIYFWIRESEARGLDFSNAWVILQCC